MFPTILSLRYSVSRSIQVWSDWYSSYMYVSSFYFRLFSVSLLSIFDHACKKFICSSNDLIEKLWFNAKTKIKDISYWRKTKLLQQGLRPVMAQCLPISYRPDIWQNKNIVKETRLCSEFTPATRVTSPQTNHTSKRWCEKFSFYIICRIQ